MGISQGPHIKGIGTLKERILNLSSSEPTDKVIFVISSNPGSLIIFRHMYWGKVWEKAFNDIQKRSPCRQDKK